jgi:hypothetical protein
MNANKEYFGDWKRESRFMDVSGKYSMNMFKNSSFFTRVIATVKDCSLQMSIRLFFTEDSTIDLSMLPEMKSFTLHGSKITSVVFPSRHYATHSLFMETNCKT